MPQLGPPRMLIDMRHVYTQPADRDSTPGQHEFRAMWEERPNDFLKMMDSLEKKYMSLCEKRTKTKQRKKRRAVDLSAEACKGIIDRLLAEWEQEGGKKAEIDNLRFRKFPVAESNGQPRNPPSPSAPVQE